MVLPETADRSIFDAMKSVVPVPMKVVCSWCTKVMRGGLEPVSHGICVVCIEKMERGL